ncbi:MAG: hypothetical protein HY226_06700 [Candidatus Vogelbacteria bacterium]|nr:hypothetical protein [Candidatus Vogelbacteria bacterium]
MADKKLESKSDLDIVKTALANKDFLDYLAKAPDQKLIDPSKPETVETQWQLFQTNKMVYSELKNIYSTKVKEEMDIELDDKDLKSIGNYLETKTLTYPEDMVKLAKKVQDLKELPERIEMRKKFIYSLGSEQKLKEMESLLATVDNNNKSKSLLKRAFGFLDKISLNNFEWTPLEPIEKITGDTKWESILIGIAKFEKYLGQGAVRIYDAMRLTAAVTATIGRKILENDIDVDLHPQPTDDVKENSIDFTGASAIKSLIWALKTPISFKFTSNQWLEDERQLKNKLEITPTTAKESLAIVRQKLAQIAEAKRGQKELEAELNSLRDEVFDEHLIPTSLAMEATRQKIKDRFEKLLKDSDKGKAPIEKILEVRSEVDKVINSQTEGTLDYTKGLNLAKIDQWANKVIEARAKIDLGKAIEKIAIESHDNPLAKLEEELAPFILGSDTTKAFFVKELQKLITTGKLEKNKIILLRMLLAKLELVKVEQELEVKVNSEKPWVEKTRDSIDKAFS